MWSDRPGKISNMTVENNGGTTGLGGVTRQGFMPGRSGNPGGRPKGLARRVREAVGRDGERLVTFHVDVMEDPEQKMTDRLVAARWLADRGFGRVTLVADPPEVDSRPPIPAERVRTPERLGELLQIAFELGWHPSPSEEKPQPSTNHAHVPEISRLIVIEDDE